MKKQVLSIVVAALVVGAALADAEIRTRVIEPEVTLEVAALDMGAADHPRAKEAIVEFLALTEEQVAQWDVLLAEREEAVAPLREELRSIEEQLRELLQGESPDPAAVGSLVLAGKTLRDGIAAAHRTYVEAFEALLTVEQKAMLGAVRRAAHLAPLVPAFGTFGLVALPGR